ncbi:MAG: hypothetical protein UW38_C0001G0226 [Candidatus Saccharibacteria bacterium GW2011_GWC2_44_17]|nr:MAG: hypothetical protein UW38_C0001G0226 [Candidatus Saccharibacteria bacterium GW2011_GWC2_44_17]MBH1956222.1 hypothetical protein [Candidatus Saccharibacteria bacterium]MBH1972610.1 hypothetical protein [Candidatus Saccharibacteria bacterium]MBH1990812.1 hypothetical protein [Candidatus Saccharibacteria bacterium]OGL34012.1 MAG: hypothetical protein A3E20_05345 [Candidatus Saccharibacteria bacterium RIFCSPHIGHO2_12_FULL_47_16]
MSKVFSQDLVSSVYRPWFDVIRKALDRHEDFNRHHGEKLHELLMAYDARGVYDELYRIRSDSEKQPTCAKYRFIARTLIGSFNEILAENSPARQEIEEISAQIGDRLKNPAA